MIKLWTKLKELKKNKAKLFIKIEKKTLKEMTIFYMTSSTMKTQDNSIYTF